MTRVSCRFLTVVESQLEIGVGPSGHLLRIVDDLRDDFPPRLGILPELRLNDGHIARWTEEDGIDPPDPWHRELRPQAHRQRKHRIEVPYRQQRRFLGEQITKIRLRERCLTDRDALQRLDVPVGGFPDRSRPAVDHLLFSSRRSMDRLPRACRSWKRLSKTTRRMLLIPARSYALDCRRCETLPDQRALVGALFLCASGLKHTTMPNGHNWTDPTTEILD